MTHLHLAGQSEPTTARGSAEAEDAFYWHRSQIDSPPTDGIYRTDYRAGEVDVYCASPLAFARWVRYFGFDITPDPQGQQLTSVAAGSVAYLRRSFAVRLHYTDFSDGQDIA